MDNCIELIHLSLTIFMSHKVNQRKCRLLVVFGFWKNWLQTFCPIWNPYEEVWRKKFVLTAAPQFEITFGRRLKFPGGIGMAENLSAEPMRTMCRLVRRLKPKSQPSRVQILQQCLFLIWNIYKKNHYWCLVQWCYRFRKSTSVTITMRIMIIPIQQFP